MTRCELRKQARITLDERAAIRAIYESERRRKGKSQIRYKRLVK